jgi:hypothetical protein
MVLHEGANTEIENANLLRNLVCEDKGRTNCASNTIDCMVWFRLTIVVGLLI